MQYFINVNGNPIYDEDICNFIDEISIYLSSFDNSADSITINLETTDSGYLAAMTAYQNIYINRKQK